MALRQRSCNEKGHNSPLKVTLSQKGAEIPPSAHFFFFLVEESDLSLGQNFMCGGGGDMYPTPNSLKYSVYR